MKKRSYLWILLLAVIVGSAGWWLQRRKAVQSPLASTLTNAVSPDKSAPFPKQNTEALPNARPSTNDFSQTYSNYQQGNIGKGEMLMAAWVEQNKKPQDFFGRVVDQDTNPVPNAAVIAKLIFNTESYGATRTEIVTTRSDAEGFFQFIGLHAAGLSVSAELQGYKWGGRGEGFLGPIGDKTSPTDRAALVLWKVRGHQSLQHRRVESRVPYDGTAVRFSLLEGTKRPDGDLQVTLTRKPLQIRRGREPYDWVVKIEIVGGGLLQANDPYMFWAPNSAYKSSIEFMMSVDDESWTPELRRNFYFKDSQGRFGRFLIDLFTNSSRPDTGIILEIVTNPSGSQNLEPDDSR